MKRYSTFVFAAALFCMSALFSCTKDSDPELSIDAPAVIVFNADGTGGVSIVNISTNQPSWDYSLDPVDGNGWLSASASGNILNLIALANDTGEERGKVSIRITAGKASPVVITVSQEEYVPAGDPDFHIEGLSGDISVTYTDGSEASFTLKSDGTATIEGGGDSPKVIYSISSPATGEVLIGRRKGETITLKFENGSLAFREPVTRAGGIPIGTYAELAMIGEENALAGNYFQEADIDLLGSEDMEAKGLTRQNWEPIGMLYYESDENFPFTGSYDGSGFKLSNIYIDLPEQAYCIGLFGYVGESGSLSDIHVLSCRLTGYIIYVYNNYSYSRGLTGGICGWNSGRIDNCSVEGVDISGTDAGGICGYSSGYINACVNYGGTVSGFEDSDSSAGGGVCGFNAGTMNACSNRGGVVSGNKAGGVCGYNTSIGIITDSYNIVDVHGIEFVGGICGINWYGRVESCYNTGNIRNISSATRYYGSCIGGISGRSYGKIISCYNTGAISGTVTLEYVDNIGGICGDNGDDSTGAIINCYNTGTVSGTEAIWNFGIGGICGRNTAIVTGSYNSGLVSGTGNVGGVCGFWYADGDIRTCYWLKHNTGAEYGIGTTELGEIILPSDDNAEPFSAAAWPAASMEGWGIGDGTDGNYWKSLGEWKPGGTPDGVSSTFPKLWWEK